MFRYNQHLRIGKHHNVGNQSPSPSVKTLEGTDNDGVEHILQMADDSLKNRCRPAGELVAMFFLV
jgi:hypothetical protein